MGCCLDPDTPPPRDIAQETRDTLEAQIALAPQLFGIESIYQPRYASLGMDTLERTMLGSRLPYNLPTAQPEGSVPTLIGAGNQSLLALLNVPYDASQLPIQIRNMPAGQQRDQVVAQMVITGQLPSTIYYSSDSDDYRADGSQGTASIQSVDPSESNIQKRSVGRGFAGSQAFTGLEQPADEPTSYPVYYTDKDGYIKETPPPDGMGGGGVPADGVGVGGETTTVNQPLPTGNELENILEGLDPEIKPPLPGAPGSTGLLPLYEHSISPVMRRIAAEDARFQRAGDVSDVADIGPEAYDALRAYDPEKTKMADLLTEQAMAELEMGVDLSPVQRRLIEQSVRSGQAARGMGYGPSDIFGEVLSASEFGENLRGQRQAQAQNVIGMRHSLTGDPFMQILGRPSGQGQVSSQLLNQGQGQAVAGGPSLFDPFSPYAQDLYNTNYNASAAAKIAAANNMAGIIGGGLEAAGGLGAAAIPLLPFCWVAREVYGAGNPDWVKFSHWLREKAPRWFHNIYIKHGEAFAGWIMDKPRLKQIIKYWMDTKI